MWRSFFLAIGTYLLLLGAQCLTVDKVVLKVRAPGRVSTDFLGNRVVESGSARTLVPPDWVPWTLISTGAVTCLYSFTIPRWATGK